MTTRAPAKASYACMEWYTSFKSDCDVTCQYAKRSVQQRYKKRVF